MPGASMRLTGTAAGDLRRPWRASSAVSCESRGGSVLSANPQPRGPVSQVGWSPLLFFSFLEANPKQSGKAWQWIRSGHTLFNRLTVVQ